MHWQFRTAGQIIFGAHTFDQVPMLASRLGTRALVISGRRTEHLVSLFKELAGLNLLAGHFQVIAEPDTGAIARGLAQGRKAGADMVIAVGGGSVIDSGKAVAALIPNKGDLFDYLEVVGKARPLKAPGLALIAVPTTAGTGAEATANAVILSKEHKVKVSLRHTSMLPSIAVIDPVLTRTQPRHVTAASGLDALTQLVEPFVSKEATPFTDALCREGLMRIRSALPRVCADAGDEAAREDMCVASLASGIALANAKLGAVHGIAGPLGGMVDAPHGALCAALLVPVMRANLQALGERGECETALRRYQEIAEILTENRDSTVQEGIEWMSRLVRDLGIKGLSAWGVNEGMFSELAEKAMRASSMKGNPVKLTKEELIGIFKQALE